VSRLLRTALSYRGASYRRGASSRGAFDCTGFTRYVYRKAVGVDLPHQSSAQFSVGHPVSRGGLRPGDLLFFHTYRRGISHVGIYLGNGQMVHAANAGRGVVTDRIDRGYYSQRYVGARRPARLGK
jgi:cell wall-associated NlpC family hydrolase